MMPNTPALVQCGATVYVLGSHCKSEDGPTVKALCETFGVVQEIPERLMEACIGVMGSGPAYVSQATTFQHVSFIFMRVKLCNKK